MFVPKFLLIVIGLAMGLFPSMVSARFDDCESDNTSQPQADLVDTAIKAGDFGTLVTALKGADLVKALRGKGPFTVFAPSDSAFEKLPKEVLADLLRPESKNSLAGILTYHVLPGRFDSRSIIASGGKVTLNGQRIGFSKNDDGVMVNGASVIASDIECSNGIIHVIDQVILPSSKNIVDTAKTAKIFETLLTAATKAGLAEVLQKSGPFTVFAPTDEAFAKLPEGTVENLLLPENSETLASILKFHLVNGRIYTEQALSIGSAKTLQGKTVKIRVINGEARVQKAKILKTDIDASNGVIHVIDSVLIPSSSETSFRPIIESPMPAGFPDITPVGEIELKRYPEYRMARTAMSHSDNNAFFTLFRHIQQNKISMTAPVEMRYPDQKNNQSQSSEPTMAFLYGADAPLEPRVNSGVELVTVTPVTVVSTGNRGTRTMEEVANARARLEGWLESEHPELEMVGALRVLGYNSPMVAPGNRYFEVQFEVCERSDVAKF